MVSYHQLGVLNSSLHLIFIHYMWCGSYLFCFIDERFSLFRVKYAGSSKVVPDETLESSFFPKGKVDGCSFWHDKREYLSVDWLARSPFCFFCVVDLRLFSINAGTSFQTKINFSSKFITGLHSTTSSIRPILCCCCRLSEFVNIFPKLGCGLTRWHSTNHLITS